MGMARTFQNIELFENLTVIDNLMLGRAHRVRYGMLAAAAWLGPARRSELADRAAVEDIVDFLELAQYRGFPVGLLPYGVQKRVELGRALAMQPKLLLLDEPVAGMSDAETARTAELLNELRGRHSIVVVEHDMAFVEEIAQQGVVTVLHEGSVLAQGSMRQVQSDERVIEVYLGR
jgi:branched-chain amino acid transport system ATP-binding protein